MPDFKAGSTNIAWAQGRHTALGRDLTVGNPHFSLFYPQSLLFQTVVPEEAKTRTSLFMYIPFLSFLSHFFFPSRCEK